MRWLKLTGMFFFGLALVGCYTESKLTRDTGREAAPTSASIDEFLGLIQFDAMASRFLHEETSVMEQRFAEVRAKGTQTAAQASVVNEFAAHAISLVNEIFAPDRVAQIMNGTIRQSFTQRDIDALSAFYRTQSGKAIVAELKQAIRPYVQALNMRKDAIGEDSEHDINRQLGPVFHVFSRAAESHQMAELYGTEIDNDIESRLPGARSIFDREMEPLAAEFYARLRKLTTDYQLELKYLSNP